MSTRPALRLDWCSYQAAKYAVEHWHYSKRMPRSKLACLGIWENGQFIGAILFGVGASNNLHKPYGVRATECCELVRVALTHHHTPTSRCLAVAVRLLRRAMPGLRLVVSFADQNYGHVGILYQAAGWFYAGEAVADRVVQGTDGRWRHPRAHRLRYRTETGYVRQKTLPKHRYLWPLDATMRQQIAPLAQPYPTKRAISIEDAPSVQEGEGSATLTMAL